MNFKQSSTYSDQVSLKYIEKKFPEAKIYNLNDLLGEMCVADFAIVIDNKLSLLETKIRYKYYDEMAMEVTKYNNMKSLQFELIHSKSNDGRIFSDKIYYLNVIDSKGYLFDVDSTSKREGIMYAPAHSASDGNNTIKPKPTYFLKTSEAEVITL